MSICRVEIESTSYSSASSRHVFGYAVDNSTLCGVKDGLVKFNLPSHKVIISFCKEKQRGRTEPSTRPLITLEASS